MDRLGPQQEPGTMLAPKLYRRLLEPVRSLFQEFLRVHGYHGYLSVLEDKFRIVFKHL